MPSHPIARLHKAWNHSVDGLRYAFQTQWAFRLELWLSVFFIPVAFVVGSGALETSLLLITWCWILLAELINTALEVIVDRVSMEQHPLSKAVKDMGSALVLFAIMVWLVSWSLLLLGGR